MCFVYLSINISTIFCCLLLLVLLFINVISITYWYALYSCSILPGWYRISSGVRASPWVWLVWNNHIDYAKNALLEMFVWKNITKQNKKRVYWQ